MNPNILLDIIVIFITLFIGAMGALVIESFFSEYFESQNKPCDCEDCRHEKEENKTIKNP